MSHFVTNRYISPNAAVRKQDPEVIDAQRTYNRDMWLTKLDEVVNKYNMKIAQPREKWGTTYASELPSGLPPDDWNMVPKKQTFYEGTKTDTGLQWKLNTVNPASFWSKEQTHADLKRNNSPARQRFFHSETWNNKNKAGY